MSNIWKRSLSMLLAMVMVVGMVPVGALAAEGDDFDYETPAAEVVETLEAQEPQEGSGEGEPAAVEQEVAPVSESQEAPVMLTTTEVSESASVPVLQAVVEYDKIPESTVVGMVWLDKNNEDPLLNKVMQGGLKDMVLEAAGLTDLKNAKVFYEKVDVSNPTALLMNGLAMPLYDAIAAQKTLIFNVQGDKYNKDVYIVCRNLRTATITVSASTIESEGEPADLAAQIQAKLNAAKITVEHNGDDLTELSAKYIDKALKSSFSWPKVGQTTKVSDAVTVTIQDALGVYSKSGSGSLTLVDTTPTYTVTYYKTQGGEQVAEYTGLLEGAATPVPLNPIRQYYTFLNWNGYQSTVSGDAAYVANWKADLDNDDDGTADQEQTYTVTFDYNYPDGTAKTEVKDAKWGTKIASVKPADPTVAGWTFIGWSGISGTVTGNVTVKASWLQDDEEPEETEPSVPGDPEEPSEPAEPTEPSNEYQVIYHLIDGEFFTLTTKNGIAKNPSYEDTDEDGVVWTGWHKVTASNEDKTPAAWEKDAFDFATVLTEDMELVSEWLADGDNDGVADAYTDHVYMFKAYGTENNSVMYTKTVWADEADGFDPYAQKYAKDNLEDTYIFEKWEEKESSGDEYIKQVVYYPVFGAEENQNGVADAQEQTELKITKPDTVANPGTIYVNGKAVEGAVFTRDSINGSEIKVELNGTAVVTKIALQPKTKTRSLHDEESAVENETILDLTYSNNYRTVTATMPDDQTLGEGAYFLHVYFRDARALEMKEPQDALDLAEKTVFTEEDVYNALVKSPDYQDEAVTITYVARAQQSGKVSVQSLYEAMQSYESVVSGAWNMLVNFLKLEKVDGVYYYTYSLDEVTEELDYVPEDGVVRTPELVIGNYITELTQITDPTKITELINNMYAEKIKLDAQLAASNVHPFGYNPNGEAEVTESVDIVYKDVTQELKAENVAVKVIDSRTPTTLYLNPEGENVKIGADGVAYMEFEYGKVTDAKIKQNLSVETKTKAAVNGTITLDPSLEGKSTGTYDVTATFNGDTYKPSTVTFKVVIAKATAAISMKQGVVNQESFNFEEVRATAGDAAVLQVIAGWDVTTGDVDLSKPYVNELKGKAWIIAPDDVLDLVKMALQKEYGKVPANLTLSEFKDLVTGNRKMLEKKLSAENVDIVLSFLSVVSSYVAADMDIIFGEPKDVKTGIYLNLAVLADSNYKGSVDYSNIENPEQMVGRDTAFAYGAIVISPVVAIPNRGGVQITNNGVAENIIILKNAAETANLAVTPENDTIYYYGVTGQASVYNSTANNNKAPSQSGVYVASTISYAEDGSKIGSDSAIVFIGMEEADLDVARETVVHDGAEHAPAYTVTKRNGDPGYPDIVMISGAASLENDGDLGLEDLTAEVNIDIPAWMGDLWDRFVDSRGGQKLGLDERHKMSAKITKQSLVEFLNWSIANVQKPVEILESLGIENKVVKKVTDKVDNVTDYATKGLKKVLEKVQKLNVNAGNCIRISVYEKVDGKAQITGYTERGHYPYIGIIIDSDFVPAVNAGLLVIKGHDDELIMQDTHVPYDGAEHWVETDVNNGRDGFTIIVERNENESAKSINFVMDDTMEAVVDAAIKKILKNDATVVGKTITLSQLQQKSSTWATDLATAVIDEVERVARDKSPARFDDNIENAADRGEDLLATLKTKLINKLNELYGSYPNVSISIQGKAPVKVGKYDFYTFNYGLVRASARLQIHPIYVVAAPENAGKEYDGQGTEDLSGVKTDIICYSYEGLGSEPAVVNVTDKDHLDQVNAVAGDVTRVAGADVGEYAMTAVLESFESYEGTCLEGKLEDVADLLADEYGKATHGVFTITPKKVTYEFTDLAKTYGEEDPAAINAEIQLLDGVTLTVKLTYDSQDAGKHDLTIGEWVWAKDGVVLTGDALAAVEKNYDLSGLSNDLNGKVIDIAKRAIKLKGVVRDGVTIDMDTKIADLDGLLDSVLVEGEFAYSDTKEDLVKKVTLGDVKSWVNANGEECLQNGTYPIVIELFENNNYIVTVEENSVEVALGDYICWNMQTGVYYNDVSDALHVAAAGETVQMLKDATETINKKNEEILKIKSGTTFDLNGYYVEATDLISYGVVMDSEPTAIDGEVNAIDAVSVIADENVLSGGIIISNNTEESWTQLQETNGGYLPIYDSVTNSYKFYKGYDDAKEYFGNCIEARDIKGSTANSATFRFKLVFQSMEACKIVARTIDAQGDTGLDIVLNMSWKGITGFDITYTMSDSTLSKHMHNQYNNNSRAKIMSVTAYGVDKLGEDPWVNCEPSVVSKTGVSFTSYTLEYPGNE